MRLCILALLVFLPIQTTAVAASAVSAPVEDAHARALLPEYKTIPAAKPGELTPAATINDNHFGRWTRSQGDNGARRYSSLNQITRDNVQQLEPCK
jgi:glucose dehydrogenase